MSLMTDLSVFKRETSSYLDGLTPGDFARNFVGAGIDGQVILLDYVGEQPEERKDALKGEIARAASPEHGWMYED